MKTVLLLVRTDDHRAQELRDSFVAQAAQVDGAENLQSMMIEGDQMSKVISLINSDTLSEGNVDQRNLPPREFPVVDPHRTAAGEGGDLSPLGDIKTTDAAPPPGSRVVPFSGAASSDQPPASGQTGVPAQDTTVLGAGQPNFDVCAAILDIIQRGIVLFTDDQKKFLEEGQFSMNLAFLRQELETMYKELPDIMLHSLEAWAKLEAGDAAFEALQIFRPENSFLYKDVKPPFAFKQRNHMLIPGLNFFYNEKDPGAGFIYWQNLSRIPDVAFAEAARLYVTALENGQASPLL